MMKKIVAWNINQKWKNIMTNKEITQTSNSTILILPAYYPMWPLTYMARHPKLNRIKKHNFPILPKDYTILPRKLLPHNPYHTQTTNNITKTLLAHIILPTYNQYYLHITWHIPHITNLSDPIDQHKLNNKHNSTSNITLRLLDTTPQILPQDYPYYQPHQYITTILPEHHIAPKTLPEKTAKYYHDITWHKNILPWPYHKTILK